MLSRRILNIPALTAHLLEKQRIGYALLDTQFIIQACNLVFANFINKEESLLVDHSLLSLLPNLETERHKMLEVANHQRTEWHIKRFVGTHIQGYLDITITSGQPFGADLLLTLTNTFPGSLRSPLQFDHAAQPLLAKYQQTEKALRKSEKRFREIVEISPAGIVLTSEDGNFIKVNQAFCTMLNYTEAELLGKNGVEFTYKDDVEKQLMIHQQPLTDKPRYFEKRYITKDGEIIWGSIVTKAVKDEQGKMQYRLGIIIDITARKQMEESLRQRSEELEALNIALESAVHLKDEFLANMSHELRTPLNSILGLAESLQEGIFGSLNEKQLHYLQVILNSGQHLLSLINDVLDISKIETGLFELQRNTIVVENICQISLQIIRQQAHKKQLHISFYRDPQVRFVYADERRLKQMLINLLTNAVKFTPEGGKIGLEVLGDEQQQTITFAVWDTGIGVKKAQLNRLFKPFIQLDASLNRQYEGTGLGLAMVARLAALHDGNVAVESEEGKGSRFSFSLHWDSTTTNLISPPAVTSALPSHSKTLPSSEVNQLTTILLADDNSNNVLVMAEYLSSHGYQVIIARNGIEALEKAEKYHPSLILMDIQMPDMDGITAIRCLRQQNDFVNTPIIATTALAMSGDKERCLVAGATLYLSKPMTLKNLHEAIKQLLDFNHQL
ncbi:PAS domain-containing hybrid sensor histidine kinase/response regulator [Beggiatoa leptomitoformis]|uniref:histidine kinase n=1 Tax=Beggiatoa leptomitoformis TaxID=288004 RepID=A0A2N9YBS2_9GAMM|nr:PAS domain-containing hybrid sensor histidine kinase/response regulator [Beggiatoa leptomitoformis]AUI67925.1 PAS domain S-box protein [Beggiatoa leptomitoformis]QGX03488.1 PAS domain S-box protein [Beggiatoa leptomitoformis]